MSFKVRISLSIIHSLAGYLCLFGLWKEKIKMDRNKRDQDKCIKMTGKQRMGQKRQTIFNSTCFNAMPGKFKLYCKCQDLAFGPIFPVNLYFLLSSIYKYFLVGIAQTVAPCVIEIIAAVIVVPVAVQFYTTRNKNSSLIACTIWFNTTCIQYATCNLYMRMSHQFNLKIPLNFYYWFRSWNYR